MTRRATFKFGEPIRVGTQTGQITALVTRQHDDGTVTLKLGVQLATGMAWIPASEAVRA